MDLLKRDKVAYFCSRQYAPKAVLASYDWATAQRDKVIISTFHSPLERDVMDFLLQKKRPIIYVLPARMYRRVPIRFREAITEGRLLLVSLQSDSQCRSCQRYANQAANYILSIVSEIVFGSIASGSNTDKLYSSLNTDGFHGRILKIIS